MASPRHVFLAVLRMVNFKAEVYNGLVNLSQSRAARPRKFCGVSQNDLKELDWSSSGDRRAAISIIRQLGGVFGGDTVAELTDDNPRFIDYYEFMQISPKARPETIQSVYRILAGRCHPDNGNSNLERFLRLKQALETLIHPERRAAYDEEYRLQQSLPVDVFNMKDFATGIDGEANRRMGLLCLFYHRRRVNPDEPGLSLWQLENMMVSAREHLLFTVWYLKDKGYIRQTGDSGYAITSPGVDHVEQGLPRNRLMYQPLKEADDGSSASRPNLREWLRTRNSFPRTCRTTPIRGF